MTQYTFKSGVFKMIMLMGINKKEFCLNCDLIYRIDEAHDTIITLVDGKTLRVVDEIDVIVDKIKDYKRSIFIKLPEGIQ
jgi:flagellar protein FlbD